MSEAQTQAMAIYQELLDRMGAALIAGDAVGFLRHIFLPCRLVTETDDLVIDTPEVAQRHFNGFHTALRAQNVDAYTRIALAAVFDGSDTIEGRHDTIITSGGKLVVPRFANEMRITRQGGIWGAAYVRHHTRYVAWPDVLPRGGAPS